MPRLGLHSVAIVLGVCLAAAGTATAVAAQELAATASEEVPGWQKLWHPAFKPRLGAGTSQMNVQRLDERFAVVGGDDRGAVVWWSDDGLRWERSPSSDATERGEGVAITGEPGRYVMGGQQRVPTSRARLWHSSDGLAWTPTSTKMPRDTTVYGLATLPDGTFVAYGDSFRHDGCWMASSADDGASWEVRWPGEWEPSRPEYAESCVTTVTQVAGGLLGRAGMGISESTDGVSWRELVSAKEIRRAHPKGTRRWVDVGLAPLGDDRYVLGGKGKRTLVWSRESGLERIDGPVDWSGMGQIRPAFGPQRAVAVKYDGRAPLVSPPADVHVEPWEFRGPVCHRYQPTIKHLAAMLPSERIDCHGGRQLTFEAWIPYSEHGGICPFGAPFSWMFCDDYWLASGPGPSPSHLNYALAPNARLDKGVQSWSGRVLVTGHFDDPAAARCPEPDWDGELPEGWRRMTRDDFIEECRQQFVVTEMRRIKD